jgi:hypothetical protein
MFRLTDDFARIVYAERSGPRSPGNVDGGVRAANVEEAASSRATSNTIFPDNRTWVINAPRLD